MDFNVADNWTGDEIHASTPINYDVSDIFIAQPKIKKELDWPVKSYKYPVKKESFTQHREERFPQITENMLIIMLLVILVVMSTMIYTTVKQTCETLRLLTAMMASPST